MLKSKFNIKLEYTKDCRGIHGQLRTTVAKIIFTAWGIFILMMLTYVTSYGDNNYIFRMWY